MSVVNQDHRTAAAHKVASIIILVLTHTPCLSPQDFHLEDWAAISVALP